MELIFYTTGCPKCSILRKKMDAKNLNYKIVDDVEYMVSEKGFLSVPVLEVNGEAKDFPEAVKWINELEG